MQARFEHKKSLGQHFLNSARIPKRMADAGNVVKGDIVLEIGPGTGALTRALLDRGASVIALEADERAISVLHEAFQPEIEEGRLTIVHGDARFLTPESIDPRIQPGKYKLIANIPYYLSGMLFRTFLECDTQPQDLVFLVQKEVAERIARDPKESLLSLSVKVYGHPEYVTTVKRGNFTPPPKIDSAIIRVHTISKNHFVDINEADFFTLIHTGLKSKRKQLVSNLTELFPRELLTQTFLSLAIPTNVRGEDLPLETWLALTKKLF